MKKIPIGIDSFKEIRSDDFYYVDKTKFVSKFLGVGKKVTLITRPRRFGKTLNMDMVKTFLDSAEDTHTLFDGLDIMNTKYADKINSAPVLFFTFKDCKGPFANLVRKLKLAIETEYDKYSGLRCDLSMTDLRRWDEVVACLGNKGNADDIWSMSESLQLLCKVVSTAAGVHPYLLIDEYDTPMISAYECGCYNEVRDFFSSLYGTALKGNTYLNKALLTGINRIAKENIFSGLNNLYVDTVGKKSEYSDCFGFTEPETASLLESAGMSLTPEVKAYYDGYRMGTTEIYNPWSILFYIDRKRLDNYWVNTSGNVLLINSIRTADRDIKSSFEELMIDGHVSVAVDLESSSFENNTSGALWGLFVNSGYLTFDEDQSATNVPSPEYKRLRMVNEESKSEFEKIIRANLGVSGPEPLTKIITPLVEDQNVDDFLSLYRYFLLGLPSYYDLVSENSYHLILLMMCITLRNHYDISSNRETGRGRYDILIRAKNPSNVSTIIELKYIRDLKRSNPKYKALLAAEAETALQQIKDQCYCTGLTGRVLMLGLAHAGKDCMASYEIIDIPGTDSASAETHMDW